MSNYILVGLMAFFCGNVLAFLVYEKKLMKYEKKLRFLIDYCNSFKEHDAKKLIILDLDD